MTEIELTPEQEREAEILAVDAWDGRSTCNTVCRELVALRAVADAAGIYIADYAPEDLERLEAALKAAGREG